MAAKTYDFGKTERNIKQEKAAASRNDTRRALSHLEEGYTQCFTCRDIGFRTFRVISPVLGNAEETLSVSHPKTTASA